MMIKAKTPKIKNRYKKFIGTFKVFAGKMLRKNNRNMIQNDKLKTKPILCFLKILKAPKRPVRQTIVGNKKFKKILGREICISLKP